MDVVPPAPGLLDAIKLGGVLSAAMVILVTYLAVRVTGAGAERLGSRFSDKRLLLNQVNTLAQFGIWLGGIALAISVSVSLSKEALLGLTGTAAVTIGLALKDLAASVLAGIIIIVDRPFQVGDRVSFAGTYGEVTAIGLRSVRLVTLDDNVVTIPNNKFLTEMVASGNWGALDMLIQMDFHIGMDQDRALARRLLEEVITSSRYAYLEKPWTVLMSQVVQPPMLALRLRAKVYVLDVQYEKALETDLTERLMAAFDAHGILPPALLHRQLADAAVSRAA